MPRSGGGGVYHGGGVAGARHPQAGTGYGSHYSHGGYYGGHYGSHYYPYYGYGYGYYPYYYGSPYFYGSLYFGWPSSYYYGAPYASGDYSPNYTSNYYAAPTSDNQAESAPPPNDYDSGAGAATGENDRNAGQLRLEVRPEDTSVYVDDRFCGTAREARGLRLPPGRHSVELVRPGFTTEHREIDIATGGRSDLSVEMQRRH